MPGMNGGRSCLRRLVALAATPVAVSLIGCAVPSRIEKRGNFQVEYFNSDALGHLGTRRALYHLSGTGGRTHVTDAAVEFAIAPVDADRLIYETCDLSSGGSRYGEQSACRHVFFDGHSGKSFTIGRGLELSLTPLEETNRWSGNGRFVALGDQYELAIVDLQSGKSTRLGGALRLEQPFYPQKWQYREVRWAQWSPDGMHGALIVLSPNQPGLPVREFDQELYSFDPETEGLTMVATRTGTAGASGGDDGLWRVGDLQWDGATLKPLR